MKKIFLILLLSFSILYPQRITVKRSNKQVLTFRVSGNYTSKKLEFAVKETMDNSSSILILKKNSLNGGADSLLSASYSNGITTILTTLYPEDTQDLESKAYFYDVTMIGSERTTILTPNILFIQGDVNNPLSNTNLPNDGNRYIVGNPNDFTVGQYLQVDTLSGKKQFKSKDLNLTYPNYSKLTDSLDNIRASHNIEVSSRVANDNLLQNNIDVIDGRKVEKADLTDSLDLVRSSIVQIQSDSSAKFVNYLGDNYTNPLIIPTYDGNLSATHPSVVYFSNSWNGYKYWMAFTPYPDASRENPSIVVSNDGIKWTVPKGLTNPVVTISEAETNGYQFCSDPCLAVRNDSLYLYYRLIYNSGSGNDEAIYLKKSGNGVTWGSGRLILSDINDNTYYLLSPSVFAKGDSLIMYCVDDSQTDNTKRLTRRSSINGITWTSPRACVTPSVSKIWHMEIRYADKYYCLFTNSSTYRLYFYESTDGITWNISPYNVNQLGTLDAKGEYKSSFIVQNGNPVKFRIWKTGILDDNTTVFTSTHRINYMEYAPSITSNIWIPVQSLYISSGSPTYSTVNSRHYVLNFHDAANAGALADFMEPTSINSAVDKIYKVYIVWVNSSTATGNVVWSLGVEPSYQGQTIATAGNAPTYTVTALGQYILNKSYVANVFVNPFAPNHIRIWRVGADGNDTLMGDAGLLGILLEKY